MAPKHMLSNQPLCEDQRPSGRLGSGSHRCHRSEFGRGSHAEEAVPTPVVVVFEVAVQGAVHRGAGEVVWVLTPALDAHRPVGALDDAAELRRAWWQHQQFQAALLAVVLASADIPPNASSTAARSRMSPCV